MARYIGRLSAAHRGDGTGRWCRSIGRDLLQRVVEKFVADIAKTKNITAAEMEQEFFHTVRPSSLLQRFARLDEVAPLVAFLASPLSSATNGAALRAEGGVVGSIF